MKCEKTVTIINIILFNFKQYSHSILVYFTQFLFTVILFDIKLVTALTASLLLTNTFIVN